MVGLGPLAWLMIGVGVAALGLAFLAGLIWWIVRAGSASPSKFGPVGYERYDPRLVTSDAGLGQVDQRLGDLEARVKELEKAVARQVEV